MNPLILLLLLQTQPTGPDDSCIGAATTQSALNACAAARLDAADSRLASFVLTYQAKLAPAQSQLFEAAQRNWEKFRKTACAFKASGVSGGSAYPMVLARCLSSMADARLSELQQLARCQDGDYECPPQAGPAPNNAFKPTLLRYTNNMAGKACHVVGSATQGGLT